MACTEDNVAVVKLLLEQSASVNIQDIDGETCLVRACLAKNTQLIQLLLSAGSDPSVNRGQPLDLVVLSGFKEGLQLLLEHGADIHQGAFLNTACQQDNIEMMKVHNMYIVLNVIVYFMYFLV